MTDKHIPVPAPSGMFWHYDGTYLLLLRDGVRIVGNRVQYPYRGLLWTSWYDLIPLTYGADKWLEGFDVALKDIRSVSRSILDSRRNRLVESAERRDKQAKVAQNPRGK